MAQGKLIAICGIDGSGKTTLASAVRNRLQMLGRRAIVYKPLSDEHLARFLALKPLLATMPQLGDELEAFAHQHVTFNLLRQSLIDLRALLETHDFVICDRYYVSHLANQAAFGYERIPVLEAALPYLPKPDAYFLVRIEPQLAHERIMRRGGATDLESRLSFLKAAADRFEALAGQHHLVVLDGGAGPDALEASVLDSILRMPS